MDIKIVNKNRVVNCTVLHNPNSTKTLIIAPAIGVSRNFYKEIANYYFNQSYNVLFFDYYAMINHEKVPKHSKLKISDWGREDVNSVIDFTKEKFPENDLFFLGHSIAGQVFPLADKSCEIKAAYFVASQNVSNKNWSGVFRLKVLLFWYFLIPLCTTLFGYLPSFIYGGKYNLHKSIARDWAKLGKSKFGILGVEKEAYEKYKNMNLPVKFLSFSDDHILAPKKSAENLYNSYGSPYKLHDHINPKEVGMSSIGHFNFFKPKYAFLWPKIDSWFNVIDSLDKKPLTKEKYSSNLMLLESL